MWVELVFMMLILKLPVVYVCWVVWWAIRAEPRPYEGAALLAETEPEPRCGWGRARRPRRPVPSGGRVRARRAVVRA